MKKCIFCGNSYFHRRNHGRSKICSSYACKRKLENERRRQRYSADPVYRATALERAFLRRERDRPAYNARALASLRIRPNGLVSHRKRSRDREQKIAACRVIAQDIGVIPIRTKARNGAGDRRHTSKMDRVIYFSFKNLGLI